MIVILLDKVWGGMVFFFKDIVFQVVDVVVFFINNVVNDFDSNFVVMFIYMFDFKDIVVVIFYVNMVGVEKFVVYKEWFVFFEIMNMVKNIIIVEMVFEYNIFVNFYDIWFIFFFKNDVCIFNKVVEFYVKFVEDFKVFIFEQIFIIQCFFQFFFIVFGKNLVVVGGNIMGVEC